MPDEKIIEKIAKLKAHAESAKNIGNEAEAQAFAEAFQRLMMTHKISMSDVEFSTFEREEPVGKRVVDYDEPGIKTKKTRVQWSERLAGIVARAHFCRSMIHRGSNRITLVGRPSDVEVAEFVFVTLHRLSEKIAEKEYVRYFHECRRAGDVTQARGFRASFLQAFIVRLSERYDELKAKATGEASALVRVDRATKAVDDFMEANSKKARALSTSTRANAAGIQRGTRLANEVELGAKAVKGGRKPNGLLG